MDSPDDNYRFEYFTTSIKDRQTGEPRLTRTYRLLDLIRGGVTPEPWDAYDLDKQTTLVTNLMKFGRYCMAKIVCGWEVICPTCGHACAARTGNPPQRHVRLNLRENAELGLMINALSRLRSQGRNTALKETLRDKAAQRP